jgi:hypothetical protein
MCADAQSRRRQHVIVPFCFRSGSAVMTHHTWLFAISIAWLCVLLYAAVFLLFVH